MEQACEFHPRLTMSLTASLTTPSPASSFSSAHLSIRLRRIALPGLFGWFGLVMGSWAGRIPALRESLQLSHQMLSLVLLCGGLGAVLSFSVSSRLMTRFGARHSLLIAGSAMLLALTGIGLAPGMPVLMLAVLALGVAASSFDVSMNAVAAHQEKRTGSSAMSMLHACACAGGLTGAMLGSLMAGMAVSPARHFLLLALPLGMLLRLGHAGIDGIGDSREKTENQTRKRRFTLPHGPLVLLGALGFLGTIAEGSIANWSGIFMKDHFGASDGIAPLSLTVFSAMMLISRLFGDKLKLRHGARKLVCGGALLAAAGLFFAMLAPNAQWALGGFAGAGLGLALVFPFVFSAAGRQGSAALASVATMTYCGSLIGPPLLGAMAQHLGMQMAMGCAGCLGLMIALVASRSCLLARQ